MSFPLEIVKKCGGLPLAIITIASLLANQPARLRKEWESIRNSMGARFGRNSTLEGMRQILYLSFKNLPRNLRTCFLYLGMYPEDHVIARDDLIRQWVAEGFISHSHGRDLEDVAKSYFNELINRSLIQPESTDCEEISSCRLHDMMLDLILNKCADDNFISVAYNTEEMERQHDYKVRRLSLDFRAGGGADGTIVLTTANSLSQVRSLALFAKWTCIPPPLLLFENLRVMVFEFRNTGNGHKIKVDLTPIGQLFQLRYVKVAGDASSIIKLPSEIQGLQYLETLELHSVSIRSMPPDIVHLPRLTHLIVPWLTMLPDGIGNMKSLCTLRSLDMANIKNVMALSKLTNLRGLGLYYVLVPTATGIDALVTSLEKLGNLRYLDVCHCGSMYNDEADRLGSLPHPPLHLERLEVGGWQLPRIPRWICELPSLIILYLHVMDRPKDEAAIIFDMGFASLEQLYFWCGRNTPLYMRFLPGVLPKLRHLEIYFDEWEWGGTTPDGMEHLLGLRSMEVYMCFRCDEGGKSQYRRATDSRAGCAFMNATQVHPRHPALSMHYIPLTRGASPPLFVW